MPSVALQGSRPSSRSTETVAPCIAPLACPPVRRACGYGSARWPLLPQSCLWLAPNPSMMRRCRDIFLGQARHLVARARPSARRSRSSRPVHLWALLTSLRGRLHRPPFGGRMFAPLSIGQQRPAHAPRGQQRGAAVHVVHLPTAQARDRADRSSVEASHPGRSASRSGPKALGRPP